MNSTTTVMGAKAFGNRMARFAGELQREVESVLKQEARALAVELGAANMPLGFDDAGAEKFRGRVEGDVRRVFASRSKPSQVFRLMQARAPELAKAYWHAYKSNKPRRMAQLITLSGIPQGLDPTAHQRARTGIHGRVPKNAAAVSLAREPEINSYARRQRAKVGLAKAGWFAAAVGLGGRVRRNLRSADGKRRTEEIFPAFIRKLARRYPGLGGARVTTGTVAAVEIWTSVRYAQDALPDALFTSAMDTAQAKLREALATALRELNRTILKAA